MKLPFLSPAKKQAGETGSFLIATPVLTDSIHSKRAQVAAI
jgi:hypothetical protein